MDTTKQRPVYALLLFVVLLSVYRLAVAAYVPISPDEAYYWTWSRHLDVCYYDQPGMVAWVDWLFALPWSRSTAFTVRLAAVMLSGLTTFILYFIYRDYRRQEGEAAVFAMVFSILPFSWLAGFMMIHDTSMLPWLALSYWMIVRLDRYDGRAHEWLFLAVALAGAMYAKFSAVMVVWGLVLYMIVSPRGRRWWKTWPPYAAGVIAALLYLPVIFWNAGHDWISLDAVTELTDQKELSLLDRLNYFLEYVGSQVGIFSPLLGITVFGALILGVRDIFRNRADSESVLPVCLALPVFLYFLVQSFQSHVYGNWPGVAYIPAAMPGMKAVAEAWRSGKEKGIFGKKFVKAGLGVNIVLVVLFSLHLQFDLFNPLLSRVEERFELRKPVDWRLEQDFRNWGPVMDVIDREKGEDDFIITRRYQVASMIEFMLPGQPFVECYTRGERGNQWDLWADWDEKIGKDALYVDYKKRMPPGLEDSCAGIEPVISGFAPGPEKKWYIYRCKSFQGLSKIKEEQQ